MKTTVRIVTVSIILSLGGALTAAWGAESVMDLISRGESTMAKVESSKAALEAITQKNIALKAQGEQINAENAKLQAGIAAFKQASADLNQKITAYNQTCDHPKTDDQYKSCKAQNQELQQESARLKSKPDELNQQQKTWIAAATAYNQQVKDLPAQAKDADSKYRNSVSYLYDWLDKARDMVASPAFQSFAKKSNAGCPNVMKPPKTLDGVMDMGNQIIHCLKKVAGTS